jgi:hypothetical protein
MAAIVLFLEKGFQAELKSLWEIFLRANLRRNKNEKSEQKYEHLL